MKFYFITLRHIANKLQTDNEKEKTEILFFKIASYKADKKEKTFILKREDLLMETFIVFASLVAVIVYITFSRHKERMKMIQSGKYPYTRIPQVRYGSTILLLGLVVIAVGLALLISSVLVMRHFDRGLMMASLILLFGGGATLLYWKLTAKDREFARRIHQEHLTRIAEEYSPSGDQEEKSEDQ